MCLNLSGWSHDPSRRSTQCAFFPPDSLLPKPRAGASRGWGFRAEFFCVRWIQIHEFRVSNVRDVLEREKERGKC